MLELSDLFFPPNCNTQKCDSREIILSRFFIPSLVVVWVPQFKKYIITESPYLTYGIVSAVTECLMSIE